MPPFLLDSVAGRWLSLLWVIDDRDLYEIPFLAGKDFLIFFEAMIMDRRLVMFPCLGCDCAGLA